MSKFQSASDARQVAAAIEQIVAQQVSGINAQLISRAYRVSNELTNAVGYVLRGERTGKRYKVPGTYKRQRDKASGKMLNGVYYTASAPGEPPARRTGVFRNSWRRRVISEQTGKKVTVKAVTESDIRLKNGDQLGEILENGTKGRRMAPRPYAQLVKNRARDAAVRIFREPYFK